MARLASSSIFWQECQSPSSRDILAERIQYEETLSMYPEDEMSMRVALSWLPEYHSL